MKAVEIDIPISNFFFLAFPITSPFHSLDVTARSLERSLTVDDGVAQVPLTALGIWVSAIPPYCMGNGVAQLAASGNGGEINNHPNSTPSHLHFVLHSCPRQSPSFLSMRVDRHGFYA
jgi:hypothetical protein